VSFLVAGRGTVTLQNTRLPDLALDDMAIA
jgi:hypothetical protein